MSAPSGRLPAIDRLRGLVMVLMTIDHASGAFNAGRLMTDSVSMYQPGTPLPAAQFFTRWVTHLCAPTFVFLAGTSLALSLERRREGATRFLVTRGLFIAALDPLWMSWMWFPHGVLFQVLYGIGMSFVAMALLYRLPRSVLVGLAVAILLGTEAILGFVAGQGHAPLWLVPILSGGPFIKPVLIAYPVLPWLAIMLLGFCFGPRLARKPSLAVLSSVGLLALFAVVRGANGYGNLGLLREGTSLIQWLHCSKYPPSISYTTLELGIAGLLLALFSRWRGVPPLELLGRTAFFFYLIHAHLLHGAAALLHLEHRGGVATTLIATVAAVAVLTPLCAWYDRYKRAHPNGLARYV